MNEFLKKLEGFKKHEIAFGKSEYEKHKAVKIAKGKSEGIKVSLPPWEKLNAFEQWTWVQDSRRKI